MQVSIFFHQKSRNIFYIMTYRQMVSAILQLNWFNLYKIQNAALHKNHKRAFFTYIRNFFYTKECLPCLHIAIRAVISHWRPCFAASRSRFRCRSLCALRWYPRPTGTIRSWLCAPSRTLSAPMCWKPAASPCSRFARVSPRAAGWPFATNTPGIFCIPMPILPPLPPPGRQAQSCICAFCSFVWMPSAPTASPTR